MCWSCTEEMPDLRQVVSDHQRKAIIKYCGGYAPGTSCTALAVRSVIWKGREQRELADDHPLKQIYEKRLNTINRYVKRGTLTLILQRL